MADKDASTATLAGLAADLRAVYDQPAPDLAKASELTDAVVAWRAAIRHARTPDAKAATATARAEAEAAIAAAEAANPTRAAQHMPYGALVVTDARAWIKYRNTGTGPYDARYCWGPEGFTNEQMDIVVATGADVYYPKGVQ